MTHSESKSELRESLLEAETVNEALAANYKRKRNAMFEFKLSVSRKIWFTALTVFSVSAGSVALLLAMTETLPKGTRTALLVGVAFAAAWSVYFIRLLIRGRFNRQIDMPTAAGMAFTFSLVMCVVLAIARVPVDHVLLLGMLFLIPAALIVLKSVVAQSEMRTQERIVELQYRIARLAEKLDDGSGDAAAIGRR